MGALSYIAKVQLRLIFVCACYGSFEVEILALVETAASKVCVLFGHLCLN